MKLVDIEWTNILYKFINIVHFFFAFLPLADMALGRVFIWADPQNQGCRLRDQNTSFIRIENNVITDLDYIRTKLKIQSTFF